MKLSAKRRRAFVNEYLKDGNVTQAAIRAGYSARSAHVTGCRLLKNANVAEEIARRQGKVAAAADVEASWVVAKLKEVAERCLQAVPVVVDGKPVMIETPNGVVAPAYRFNSMGATRALDLLGRVTGIYRADNKQRAASAKMEDVIKALDKRDRRQRERVRQAQEQNDGAATVSELRRTGS